MKLAYADPPYIGQAKRHYSNDPSGIPAEEVDYLKLITRLLRDYDGFALSASSPSIPTISRIIHGPEPGMDDWHPDIRMACWCKPWASWKPTNRVQYTWEPVFFKPVRPRGSRAVLSTRDYVIANITMNKGTHGAKPDAFNDWVLNLLGYQLGDEFDDLFPGTEGMTKALEKANFNKPPQ